MVMMDENSSPGGAALITSEPGTLARAQEPFNHSAK